MTQAFPRRGRSGSLCVLFLSISLVLTACAPNIKREGPDMTPAESVALLYDIYAKTIAHLGQEEWEPVPKDATYLGIAPEECQLRSGEQGVRYSDNFFGPPSAQPEASAQTMASYWSSLGMQVETIHSTNPLDDRIRVEGDDARIGVEYTVNGERSSIDLVTTCIPGDWNTIVDGVIAHRRAQSASPAPGPPAQ